MDALASSLRRGDNALESVPALLKRILHDGMWREFVTQRGELVKHQRFVDFVITPPLKGVGADVRLVRRIVADDAEALDLLDQALKGIQGSRTDLHNNVTKVSQPEGNSREKALRRLRKDAPELHADVLAGRMSAHAAMIEAGFRPRTFSVRADDADAVARSLRKHMSAEDLARLAKLLGE
ncbi:hypothetical protein AB0I55_29135 [Actinocatenispora sera]|uniref:hypothetical protein n=1 Tax=Actinocatenispora sera TaxID=390989 RepID=UPI0033F2794B